MNRLLECGSPRAGLKYIVLYRPVSYSYSFSFL